MLNVMFPVTDLIGCRFPKVTGRNGEVEVDPNSKEYIYRLLPGMEPPNKGDMVVTSCINGFQVCVVTSINVPTTTFKDVAYVVDVVHTDAYREQLERVAVKESLHRQLIQMKKKLEDEIGWEILAEKSPEFKALLEAYKGL